MEALRDIEAELHRLPSRSQDLNPPENIFHLVKTKLEKEALGRKGRSEFFEQFTERVFNSFQYIDIKIVDKTIESFNYLNVLIIVKLFQENAQSTKRCIPQKEKFLFSFQIWIYGFHEIYFRSSGHIFLCYLCWQINYIKNKIQLKSYVSMFVFPATKLSTPVVLNTVLCSLSMIFFAQDYMFASFNCSLSLHVNTREICTLQIAFLNSTIQ